MLAVFLNKAGINACTNAAMEERNKRWIDGLGMGGHAKQFSKLVAVQKEDL